MNSHLGLRVWFNFFDRTLFLSLTYTGGGSMYSYATGVAEDIAPVWNDLLTSYNGNTITYDAIGNSMNW